MLPEKILKWNPAGSGSTASEPITRLSLQRAVNAITCNRRRFFTGGMLIAAVLFLVGISVAHADLGAPSTATVYGAQVIVVEDPEAEFIRQIGKPHDIDELARRMLEAIGAWSAYDTDVPLPMVKAVPLKQMQQRLCGGPCNIRAAYVPGEGLYFDAQMQPLSNRYHQSILFHELVHHVQVANGSHPGHGVCHRWGRREAEAYAMQNRYLFAIGQSRSVLNPGRICASARAESR